MEEKKNSRFLEFCYWCLEELVYITLFFFLGVNHITYIHSSFLSHSKRIGDKFPGLISGELSGTYEFICCKGKPTVLPLELLFALVQRSSTFLLFITG